MPTEKYKFYTEDGKKLNIKVSYRVIGENNQTIFDVALSSCFASVTYHPIDATATLIEIYRPFNEIPYSFDFIEKWIKELNEFGFPCEVKKDGDVVYFYLILKNFKYKAMINCTLQLVRCLFENGICIIPELYYQLVEKSPNKDKFLLLQDAHKDKILTENYANTNHMVTHHRNRYNISKQDFEKNIVNSRATTFEHLGCRLDDLWNGNVDNSNKSL